MMKGGPRSGGGGLRPSPPATFFQAFSLEGTAAGLKSAAHAGEASPALSHAPMRGRDTTPAAPLVDSADAHPAIHPHPAHDLPPPRGGDGVDGCGRLRRLARRALAPAADAGPTQGRELGERLGGASGPADRGGPGVSRRPHHDVAPPNAARSRRPHPFMEPVADRDARPTPRVAHEPGPGGLRLASGLLLVPRGQPRLRPAPRRAGRVRPHADHGRQAAHATRHPLAPDLEGGAARYRVLRRALDAAVVWSAAAAAEAPAEARPMSTVRLRPQGRDGARLPRVRVGASRGGA